MHLLEAGVPGESPCRHPGKLRSLETHAEQTMENLCVFIEVETSVFHNLFACTILVSLSPVLGFSCTKNNKNKHSQCSVARCTEVRI